MRTPSVATAVACTGLLALPAVASARQPDETRTRTVFASTTALIDTCNGDDVVVLNGEQRTETRVRLDGDRLRWDLDTRFRGSGVSNTGVAYRADDRYSDSGRDRIDQQLYSATTTHVLELKREGGGSDLRVRWTSALTVDTATGEIVTQKDEYRASC
jgi:hypothetical protein